MLKEIEVWLNTNKRINLLEPIQYLKDKSLKLWIIQIIFILIALVYGLTFYFNKGVFESDEIFNLLRIKEVGLSLIHGQWSQFNLYTGTPEGLATNTFYPYLFLIPFALLSTVIPLTHLMGIISGTIALIGLEVCYIVFRKVQKDSKLASFLISICFWFSSTMAGLLLANAFDIGASIASIFIPIVFAGWIKWIQDNHWKTMLIGLLGMLFANEPSCFIMMLGLFILTIFQIKAINLSRIKTELKSILLFILCGMVYILPILWLHFTNKIDYPNELKIRVDIPITIIPKSTMDWLTPFGYMAWDILGLLTLILLVIYWKHIDTFTKQLSGVALILILTNIKPINDFLINHTPLSVIQDCGRFAIISNFFLCIVLVNILNYIFKVFTKQDLWQGVIYFVILIHAFWLLFVPMKVNMTNYSGQNMTNHNYIKSIQRTFMNAKYAQHRYKRIAVRFNKNTNHTVIAPLMYPDYAPTQAFRTKNTNFHASTNIYHNNGFDINHIKYKQDMKLPLIIYHQQKYHITNNGQLTNWKYDKHYTKIQLHKGNNRIRITTPIMWYRYAGLIVSLISIIYLIISSIRYKRIERRQ